MEQYYDDYKDFIIDYDMHHNTSLWQWMNDENQKRLFELWKRQTHTFEEIYLDYYAEHDLDDEEIPDTDIVKETRQEMEEKGWQVFHEKNILDGYYFLFMKPNQKGKIIHSSEGESFDRMGFFENFKMFREFYDDDDEQNEPVYFVIFDKIFNDLIPGFQNMSDNQKLQFFGRVLGVDSSYLERKLQDQIYGADLKLVLYSPIGNLEFEEEEDQEHYADHHLTTRDAIKILDEMGMLDPSTIRDEADRKWYQAWKADPSIASDYDQLGFFEQHQIKKFEDFHDKIL